MPLGLLAGVYLAEFGKAFAGWRQPVRFAANILMGTPSILIGVFVYALMVLSTGHFSGFAGAVALALIILPVVIRTTEDMLYLVPDALRESALALGALRWKVTLGIVFRAAKSGLLTGIILAVARVSGESAPLLFTALNSPYWISSLGKPTANLTVTIFQYAMSPYDDWQRMAWGASLLITAGVLSMMLLARFIDCAGGNSHGSFGIPAWKACRRRRRAIRRLPRSRRRRLPQPRPARFRSAT